MWQYNPKGLVTTGVHATRALKLVPRVNFEKIGKPSDARTDRTVVGSKIVDAYYKVGGKMFRCELQAPRAPDINKVGDQARTHKFEAFWWAQCTHDERVANMEIEWERHPADNVSIPIMINLKPLAKMTRLYWFSKKDEKPNAMTVHQQVITDKKAAAKAKVAMPAPEPTDMVPKAPPPTATIMPKATATTAAIPKAVSAKRGAAGTDDPKAKARHVLPKCTRHFGDID
jgi:hypothetical protein